ncbi:hypothetical protein JCM11491_001213 [Sporobolomyces phaffii]
MSWPRPPEGPRHGTPAQAPSTFEDCFDNSRPLTLEVLEAQWTFIKDWYSEKRGYDVDFAEWHSLWWQSFAPRITNLSTAKDADGSRQWSKWVCASAIFRRRANRLRNATLATPADLAVSMLMPNENPLSQGREVVARSAATIAKQTLEMANGLMRIGQKLDPIRVAVTRHSSSENDVCHLYRVFWKRTALYMMQQNFASDARLAKLLDWSDQRVKTWNKDYGAEASLDDARCFFAALPTPMELAKTLKWTEISSQPSRPQTLTAPASPSSYTPIARGSAPMPSVLGKRRSRSPLVISGTQGRPRYPNILN